MNMLAICFGDIICIYIYIHTLYRSNNNMCAFVAFCFVFVFRAVM